MTSRRGASIPTPWSGRLPLALGHRGAPRVAPENRRTSLAAGMASLGGVETDLQLTNDGVLVLNHDPYLGSSPSLIAESDLEELRRVEPDLLTLDDLRVLLEEYPSALANLELKTSAPNVDHRAAQLAAELAGWPSQAAARVWVSSFDPLELLRLAEQGVGVPLAFLAFEASALELLPSLPVAAVHPHHSLVSRELVGAWHSAGLAVFTWTVNDGETACGMLEAGVDGLIGDEPQVLLEALTGWA